MAHFQRDKTTDEFGNPIRPTHEDPLHHGTIGTGPHGTASTGGGVTSVPLHRRSDSSSSSEDDGFGGRRKKKGLKEKIKEKLPGGKDKSDDPYGGASAAPYGGGQHEEKGMMDKIKEKLPGHH